MPQLSHPIQNVPPAIHTMFGGAAGREDRHPTIAIGTTRRIEAAARNKVEPPDFTKRGKNANTAKINLPEMLNIAFV
jgi:hypothetical protein